MLAVHARKAARGGNVAYQIGGKRMTRTNPKGKLTDRIFHKVPG